MTQPPVPPQAQVVPMELPTDSQYAQAFHVLVSDYDLTITFMRSQPLLGDQLEAAKASGRIPANVVGVITLPRGAAHALANTILTQLAISFG